MARAPEAVAQPSEGIVRPVDIEQEMRGAYLDYAMSVITARALPDVRDGLKPVQRRILYAMDELALKHASPYKKSARIVGEVLGKYHPHGDAAVYDAMVRLAQDFSMRYPLIDGQGNFGSVDGDPPAAMRYTEARLTTLAEEMLLDLDKDTVDFTDNFDGTLKEPTVLPSKLPNLLVNGSAGIAVGMATSIPPHNLGEVAEAIVHLIDNPQATAEEFASIVPGPDFPTGGVIVGLEGIKTAYATGHGRITIRAKAHMDEVKGDRHHIVVTELPYQVNKASLLEKIAELVHDRRVEGISDLRDESDRHGMRIVIELRREAQPQQVLNNLYKLTAMQTTFSVNLLVLVDGEPRVLTLKRLLQHYLDYRRQIITRRTQFELGKARARVHVLQGLRIALDNLDAVIALIRDSRDAEAAKAGLMKHYNLTEIQAQAILDMQLRRLAALERRKIEEELAETKKLIAHLEDLLAHPKKIYQTIKAEVLELKERYGDPRRTRIRAEEAREFTEEDLIADEEVVVAVTQKGYVKRWLYEQPRRRATKAVSPAKEQDPDHLLLVANNHDNVFFFSSKGRVFGVKCHALPDVGRQPKGLPLSNLVSLEPKEDVVGLLALREAKAEDYFVAATRRGKVKRVAAQEIFSARGGGLNFIDLEGGDQVVGAVMIQENDQLILVSAHGQAIRFPASEVRASGRGSGGIRGINLDKGEAVVALDVARAGGELLIVTVRGHAKRTALDEYPTQGRDGRGVVATRFSKRPESGDIVAAWVIDQGDELALVSSLGQVTRMAAGQVPLKSRDTVVEPATELEKGDQLVAVARLESRETKEGAEHRERGETSGKKGVKKKKESRIKATTGPPPQAAPAPEKIPAQGAPVKVKRPVQTSRSPEPIVKPAKKLPTPPKPALEPKRVKTLAKKPPAQSRPTRAPKPEPPETPPAPPRGRALLPTAEELEIKRPPLQPKLPL
ncbi:MAG: DNA gyrase subunit A [Chloroflexota bacterium]